MKINRIIEATVCFGAVVVIFGSWAKLTHKPYADLCLTIGLLTECFIFGIYGFQELFKKSPATTDSYTSTTDKLAMNQPENKELNETMKSIDNSLKRIFKV